MESDQTFVYQIGELVLEWNTRKAARNFQKHGVTFLEAATVFEDDDAVFLEDESHSAWEERFFLIGSSAPGRVLSIAHTERAGRPRLISARMATVAERREYDRTGRARV